MLQRLKKALAAICVLALMLSALPQPASAAATPAWSKVYTSLYENSSKNGVYTYTIKNLTVGQTVKWSLTGTGAQYAALAKESTKATTKKVSNTVTIRTNGELYAKNKLVNVTARIYDKNGKLSRTLTTGNQKIKIQPTSIEVVSSSLPSRLTIGKTYQFNYRITPANATSANTWSATYSDGSDASDCITSAGMFTPKKEGVYLVQVRAKIGAKILASDSTQVTVGTSLVGLKQIAADQLVATYSGDARSLIRKESLTLTNSYGISETIKEIAFSEDGTQVTITMYSFFRNGEVYTLKDGITAQTFTGKIGRPFRLELLTTTTTVNKFTALKYAIYDADGIDVTSVYPGTPQYSSTVINGFVLEDSQIYMTKIGDTGTIFMVYTFFDTSLQPLQTTGIVTCVAAVPSGDMNFTLTETPVVPDYNSASYKDNRTVYADHVYFMQFRALDTDKEDLPFESITYTSSDPDTLVVNNSGNGIAMATAVKAGAVTVLVTASYGGQLYSYSFVVTITPAPYLAGLRADSTLFYTSNRYPAGYKQYINLTAYDQSGQSFNLTGEEYKFTDNYTYKNLVDYDAASNRIVITPTNCVAGNYYYTLVLTANGKSASLNFTVVVQSPSESGTVTYQVDIDNPVLDLMPNADTNLATFMSDKAITIRLAEYHNGIFYGYYPIQSVRIIKDGIYYDSNLAPSSTTNIIDIPAEGNNTLDPKVILNTVLLNNYIYSTAAAGIYKVEVRFSPRTSPSSIAIQTASIELRNSQAAPTVTVARTVASTACNTALALAQNCLSVSRGEIVDCVVTGSSYTGNSYPLQAGEMINIRSVTVRVSTMIATGHILSYDVTIEIGKTLRNL